MMFSKAEINHFLKCMLMGSTCTPTGSHHFASLLICMKFPMHKHFFSLNISKTCHIIEEKCFTNAICC